MNFVFLPCFICKKLAFSNVFSFFCKYYKDLYWCKCPAFSHVIFIITACGCLKSPFILIGHGLIWKGKEKRQLDIFLKKYWGSGEKVAIHSRVSFGFRSPW